MKHFYQTTRNVENIIRFVDTHGNRVPAHDVTLTCHAAGYVFRGGKRAFAKHLEMLNAEHGQGYAIAG